MSLAEDRLNYMFGGYALAVLASSATIAVIAQSQAIFTADTGIFDQSWQRNLLALPLNVVVIIFMTIFIGVFNVLFSFVPSACLILAGELLGIRWRIYYAVAGSVAALAAQTIFQAIFGRTMHWPDAFEVATTAFPGFVGGLAYWSFAGRNAGRKIAGR